MEYPGTVIVTLTASGLCTTGVNMTDLLEEVREKTWPILLQTLVTEEEMRWVEINNFI